MRWCTKIDKYQVYSYCIPIQLYALAEYSSALVKIAELLQSTSTAVEQKSTSRAGGKAGSRRQCTSWGWPSLGQPCHGSLSSSPTNWKWLHTWINTSTVQIQWAPIFQYYAEKKLFGSAEISAKMETIKTSMQTHLMTWNCCKSIVLIKSINENTSKPWKHLQRANGSLSSAWWNQPQIQLLPANTAAKDTALFISHEKRSWEVW